MTSKRPVAVVPRPSVSVIPVRDGGHGLEVFVQHRQTTMDFAAGAVVFPGGRCDPRDEEIGAGLPLCVDVLDEHVDALTSVDVLGGDPQVQARTLLATGLRELAEETGLLAEPEALVPWDRWVTPEGLPKRFDVVFYVLPVPADAARQPAHSTSEATHSHWESTREVLAGAREGRLLLLTPTRVILEELDAFRDVATVLSRRPVITGVRDDRPEGRPRPGR